MDSRPTKRPKHQPHADYLDGSTTADESYPSPSIAILAKRRRTVQVIYEDSLSYSSRSSMILARMTCGENCMAAFQIYIQFQY